MTENKRFEVMDYFDSENKPIKAIRDTETTEIYSMDNELEANSTCGLLNTLHEENEHYKSIFFELVETALTDKSCRELYCKGILGIFDKANSLNQARDMIKEHMN